MSLLVEHVNRWFGDLHVIRDLSMGVKKGAIFGLLDPNGAGKTTTMYMISVKRQEELQRGQITTYFPIILSFVTIYIGAFVPDSLLVRIPSYVPVFSPTLILIRLVLSTVMWWEILMTLVLMLLTFLGLAWIGARLYRYGVLMYGQPPTLARIVKLVGRADDVAIRMPSRVHLRIVLAIARKDALDILRNRATRGNLLYPILMSLVFLFISRLVGGAAVDILVYNPGDSAIVQAIAGALEVTTVTYAGSAAQVSAAFADDGPAGKRRMPLGW